MTEDPKRARLILGLRRAGITDARVLAAIETVPRARFVPDTFLDQAWDNVALPIGYGQTISQPEVVAVMTEALQVAPGSKVLEIGTGSGYQAAILARLADRVFSIERHLPLFERTAPLLEELVGDRVRLRHGDGFLGWPEEAPFDRILLTAGAVEVPPALLEQLSPEGGVLLAPLGGSAAEQEIVKIRRQGNEWWRSRLGAVRFVPLLPGTA